MMTMIYHAGVLAVLALSVMGYGALYNRSRLPVCFFPVTLVSGVSVVLYGFGFLAALKMGCYAILLFGILMLLICRKGFRPIAFFSDWSFLFCLFAGVWLYVITRGAFLSHWDDGSHWYRICKSIYAEGAFPTTPDIMYYNYVPGCQLWNYFVLRFVDFSQQNCMFAQGLINIACVATLFAGVRTVKSRVEAGFCTGVIVIAAVGLCSMNIGTYVLLVDLQLGLTAMALLILLLDQGERPAALFLGGLVCTFVLLVKNSAVFFALMIFLWASLRHRWRGKQLACCAGGLLGIPLVLRSFYALRASSVYAGAAASPQSFSLTRFMQKLALKDAETMEVFNERFWFKVFIGDTGLSMTVYVCIFLLVLLLVFLHNEKKAEKVREVLLNLTFGLVMMAAYVLMLYGTYMFTMNVNETLSVNSFYRYFGSMIIVFAGMTIYTALGSSIQLAGEGNHRVYIFGMLVFAVLAMPGAYSRRYIWGQGRFDMPDHYGPKLWQTLKYFVPENRQYSGKHYVVLWDTDDFSDSVSHHQYAEYAVGAWLRSERVDAISRDELNQGLTAEMIDALTECDAVICLSDMSKESGLLAPYMDVSDLSVGLKYK